jgi:hypothetical protein
MTFCHGAVRVLFRRAKDRAVDELDGVVDDVGQLALVRRDDDRRPSAGRFPEEIEDRFRRGRVEVAGRFVGQDHGGRIRQCPGDGHALLLPAGQCRGKLVGLVGDLDSRQQLQCALAPLARRIGAAEVHRQHDVLHRRERRQELEELEDEADVAAAPRRQLAFVQTLDFDVPDVQRARRRYVDPADEVQEGRLAAA